MSKKRKLLIIAEFYKPGFKAGGPIQSVFNLAKLIADKFEIFIISRNHDLGNKIAYEYQTSEWINYENHKVKYIEDGSYNLKNIISEIKELAPDFIYLNSLFASISWLLILFNFFQIIRSKLIIAPRGELDGGALKLKNKKKSLFLKVIPKFIRSNISFHATTENEMKNIKKYFIDSKISVAENIPTLIGKRPIKQEKKKNYTEFLFISRISPKKNLLFCIEIFAKMKVDGNVIFNIIGPVEDENYYSVINNKCKDLPGNIEVKYHGAVSNSDLQEFTRDYHFLFFPTLAENYGHVIYECLSFGIPVVISDQTPWKEEDNGVFVRKLDDSESYISLLSDLHMMDNSAYQELSNKAFNFSHKVVNKSKLLESYETMFSSKMYTKE